MRAIIENSHGGPEALTISEVPAPVPRSHEVLVRVHAAGINRADALQRRGFYPPPAGASAIYGLEVAGVIEAVGEGASVENCGTPVMALLAGGGYADYVTVPVDHVLPVPEQLSFAEAAGIPEVAATVYSNLVLTCGMSMNPAENLKEDGEPAVVLVHGGTGGIGVHAIQLALAVGTRVFATVGTEEKAEYVCSLGAEPIIYTEHSFREVLLAETGGRGADYILDVVGGKYLDDNLHTLADGGHLCIIGLMGGAKAEVNLGYMLSRRLSVHATSLRTRSDRQKAEILRGVREHVLPLIESGRIGVGLDRIFDMEEAAAAHEYFDSGQHRGKIVLRMV